MDKQESHASFTGGDSDYYDLPRLPNGDHCETVQDLIVAYNMDYTRGNILKAVIRWEVKGVAYNAEKIRWFASDLLCRMRASREGTTVRLDLPEDEGYVHGPNADEIRSYNKKVLDMLGLPDLETTKDDT